MKIDEIKLSSFKFVKVNKENQNHISILYEILKKRKFNISNIEIPSYEQHVNFVKSNRYRKWVIIFKNDKSYGTYYLRRDNYIGINLLTSIEYDYFLIIKYILSLEKPLKEIKSIRNKFFLINTNPNNKPLLRAIKRFNFLHVENSYLCKKN
tara:strand:- start:85 stop:540 length:456 start_codon:yes stop_codon:yes gene_type:complete